MARPRTGYVPSRLIDVAASERPLIKLCERNEIVPTTAYIALSHCWGGTQPVTLSAQTVESLRLGFPVRDLPQTFQDAIYVCLKLGVGYIWIDSL